MSTRIHTAARTVLRALGRESKLGSVTETQILEVMGEIKDLAKSIDGVYVDPDLVETIKGTKVGLPNFLLVAGYGTDEINVILVGSSTQDLIASVSQDPTSDWMIVGNLETGAIADCRPVWSPGTWTI